MLMKWASCRDPTNGTIQDTIQVQYKFGNIWVEKEEIKSLKFVLETA